jgi:alkyl sulfatase BDS1-like metallo-beta-lactamase superfamily hydrolase
MPHPALVAHNAQFPKSIIPLAKGVWGAVGFAASNVYVVEGASSLTIIDTTESTKAAENVLAALRAQTDKPVGRIIFTHSHRDHICGASVFTEGRDIPILASATFSSDLVGVSGDVIAPNKTLGRRTQAQFGIGLSPEGRVNLGCGPGDRPMQGLGAGFLSPTELIAEDCDVDLDGVAARLTMAPGETPDHMVVWLPDTRVLISGDNWYHAFPNLYAIRGTPYRDFAAWAESLSLLASFQPEVLAPGHTLPVQGAALVQEVLSTTRAAILHVMQHTADGMDAGLPLDDIAASISLPDALADKPWLGEFYGKAAWSARAFATGTLGWYDGNPTHLGTLPSATRAGHIAKLAGGAEALRQAAEATDDLQWRLELCDHLAALDQPAHALKAGTMEALAEVEINATARNTYLWEAKRLRALEAPK